MSATTACDPFDAALTAALPTLRSRCRAITRGHTADAEDLMQDTVMLALAGRDRFEVGTNMGGWLCTIALHRFLSMRRKDKRRPTISTGDLPLEAVPRSWVRPAAEDRLVLLDAVAAIRAATPGQRAAFMACRWRGETLDHHATEAGCALGTAKSRLYRLDRRLDRVRIEGGV